MDETKGLLFSLYDSVMLLAPMGWRSLELRFVVAQGRLRLSEISTRGEGTRAPLPKPELGVDPKLEATRLGEGVAELVHLLGRSWEPGVVKVTRGDDFADWQIEDAAGALVWFTRLSKAELDSLLVTDALFNAVKGTEAAFATLQSQLEAKLDGSELRGLHDGQLELERDGARSSVPVVEVGAWDSENFTWAWGDSPRLREITSAQPPGLSAFSREQFHCDEAFAWALASHVVVSLGARGIIRLAEGNRAWFLGSMA